MTSNFQSWFLAVLDYLAKNEDHHWNPRDKRHRMNKHPFDAKISSSKFDLIWPDLDFDLTWPWPDLDHKRTFRLLLLSSDLPLDLKCKNVSFCVSQPLKKMFDLFDLVTLDDLDLKHP